MMDDMETIAARVIEAARLAVEMHLGELTELIGDSADQGQQVEIGGAGRQTFTEERLPALIARRGRSSHNRRGYRPRSRGLGFRHADGRAG